MSCEVSWFAALCDDDYEFLGVPDGRLQSSWEHCRDIALGAEQAGYDNLLLPSGYAMGIDSIAFAAGIAPLLRRMQLLVAVRMSEMWPPQLARQLATIDQMLDGRLTINIISSGLPGQSLESAATPNRTCGPASAGRALALARPSSVIPIRCSPRSAPTRTSAWTLSSCPAIRTPPKPTCSPGMCYHTLTTHHCFRAEPVPPINCTSQGGFPDHPVRATRAAAPQCLRGRLQWPGAGSAPTSVAGPGPMMRWMRDPVSAPHGTHLCTWPRIAGRLSGAR
jgi:hypothetical protein